MTDARYLGAALCRALELDPAGMTRLVITVDAPANRITVRVDRVADRLVPAAVRAILGAVEGYELVPAEDPPPDYTEPTRRAFRETADRICPQSDATVPGGMPGAADGR